MTVWQASFGPDVVDLCLDELLTSCELFGPLFTFQKSWSANLRDAVADLGSPLETPFLYLSVDHFNNKYLKPTSWVLLKS